MTPFGLARSLLEAEYSYSSTDIAPPPEMIDFILEWNRLQVPEDALVIDPDGGKGRERDPHITVKYGLLASEVPGELRQIAKDTRPFPIFLGTVSLFTTNPQFDVVKIDVESPELRLLNKRVSDAIPHEDSYPTYNPHLTLAYVKKGSCTHLVGEDPFESPESTREFIAAGMRFSGAGDDSDPDRLREHLLFSRAPKAKEVTEAVIDVERTEIDSIVDIITQCAEESNSDPRIFVALANDALQDKGVLFGETQFNVPEADETGVTIPIPYPQQLRSPYWPKSLASILYHEGVHLGQMDRMQDPKAVADKATEYVAPGGKMDTDRYLNQKQEVMAWAASMVDSWRRQGLSKEQMVQRLRSGNWGYGMKYWHNRQRYPQTFNRFVKQATEYINLSESEEARIESVNTDPFANLKFPVDPARVAQFLNSNWRKRVGRMIL